MERLEHERQELERLENERVEAARLERERAEGERVERERVEAERREQERLLQARQDQERLERERLDSARLARERQEHAAPDSEDGPAETWLTVLRSERRERQRQQEELRKREQERERLEQERAEEKRRDAEVHSALARDRQLAAEARARAEALRLSAEAEALRLRAEAEALRLRAEAERAALELPAADLDLDLEPPDAPLSALETPSAEDQELIGDEEAAAATGAGPGADIQSEFREAPHVRVSGAASRWSPRLVAAVIAAAALVIARHLWRRDETTDVQPPPPEVERVDHSATLRQALNGYQRGEVAAATNTALSIPESAAERQQALALLQTIRLDAAARTQAARLAAETAGKTGEAAFLEAVAKQQEAEGVTSPTDTERALSLLAEASRLYQQAAVSGPSAPQLLQDARRELQANRIPRAIEYALQALTTAPGDAGRACVAPIHSVLKQSGRRGRRRTRQGVRVRRATTRPRTVKASRSKIPGALPPMSRTRSARTTPSRRRASGMLRPSRKSETQLSETGNDSVRRSRASRSG